MPFFLFPKRAWILLPVLFLCIRLTAQNSDKTIKGEVVDVLGQPNCWSLDYI